MREKRKKGMKKRGWKIRNIETEKAKHKNTR